MTGEPVAGRLLAGKRALILGVANDHSIAWGIARAFAAQGAELAFTYQGEGFGRRVIPLAESLGAKIVVPADVQDAASLDALFARIGGGLGRLDVLVHAIAYSDKAELDGRFLDTSRANFLNSLDISCYSLVELTRRAAPLMRRGGSILTLTYLGAQRVTPNYNVMGVAKAALESAVRYLANDLGPRGHPGQRDLARADADAGRAPRSPARARSTTPPSATRRCGPTRRWRRWAARRSISPPSSGPAPPAR